MFYLGDTVVFHGNPTLAQLDAAVAESGVVMADLERRHGDNALESASALVVSTLRGVADNGGLSVATGGYPAKARR